MRELITALLTGLILVTGLIIVSIPASRDVVPGIRNYFSLQTGIWQNARNAEYPANVILQTRGLDDEIIIRRDRNGIPHIEASTIRDAIFALGYVTAYDRYFQMRINARIVEGSLSEWLGESYLSTDQAFLNIGLEDAAWDMLNSLNDEEYSRIQAYSSGINTFINQSFNVLKPIEFKLLNLSNTYWRPVDGLRVAMLFGHHLTFSDDAFYHQKVIESKGEQFFRDMYMRSFPGDYLLSGTNTALQRIAGQNLNQTGLDLTAAVDALESDRAARSRIPAGRTGSMNMQSIILGNSRTERNQPIFALDLQAQATQPSQFYEVHIHLPQRSIYGVTMPGFPGLIMAYNGQTAWSILKSGTDQNDFVHLEITPDHKQYRYGNQWRNFRETSKTITAREGRTVRHQNVRSEYGPVLYLQNYGIAMQSNLLKNPINPINVWDLLETETVHEVNRITDSWNWPVVLINSADRDGNISSNLAGKMPRRNSGIGIQNGNDTTKVWRSYIDANQLPSVINPESGYLAFSGQNPSTRNTDIYLGYNWPKSWQKKRMETILEQRNRHNAEGVSRIFLDVELPFRFLMNSMEANVDEMASSRLRELIRSVSEWDFKSELNSDIPILFDNFLRIFRNSLYSDLNTRERPSDRVWYYYLTNNPRHSFFDVQGTPQVETAENVLLRAFNEAYEITLIEYGTRTNWVWSSANRLRITHSSDAPAYRVLDYGNIARPGFNGTINPAPSRNSTVASIMRVVVDFGSSDQALRVNHLGSVNEDPLNSHYTLNLNRWLNGQYISRNIRLIQPEQSISNISIKSSGR